MSIRLSELTKTNVSFSGPEEPNHVVVRLTDDTLFQCPLVMMTEVGAAYLDQAEAEALVERDRRHVAVPDVLRAGDPDVLDGRLPVGAGRRPAPAGL